MDHWEAMTDLLQGAFLERGEGGGGGGGGCRIQFLSALVCYEASPTSIIMII